MSLALKTFLLLSIAVNCTRSGECFFDHLISDHGPHSYFLVINVDSPNYKGKTLIENHLLLLFLNRTQGISQERYQSFAKDLLVNKSWLKTKKVNLERWGFRKLTRIKAVDDVAAKGKEEFIKYYFPGKAGRVIKEGISDDEKNAIIERLFEWQIAASNDDVTGLLFYTEFKEGRSDSSRFIRGRHAVSLSTQDRELYSQCRFERGNKSILGTDEFGEAIIHRIGDTKRATRSRDREPIRDLRELDALALIAAENESVE